MSNRTAIWVSFTAGFVLALLVTAWWLRSPSQSATPMNSSSTVAPSASPK